MTNSDSPKKPGRPRKAVIIKNKCLKLLEETLADPGAPKDARVRAACKLLDEVKNG